MRRRRTRATSRFAQLKTFADFWAYDTSGLTCCLLVNEETADEDPEQFECDECPVAEALDTLDPFNCRVWAIYKQVVTRLAADLHAGGVILQALTKDMSADEFTETWRRLLVLYEAIEPRAPVPTQE